MDELPDHVSSGISIQTGKCQLKYGLPPNPPGITNDLSQFIGPHLQITSTFGQKTSGQGIQRAAMA